MPTRHIRAIIGQAAEQECNTGVLRSKLHEQLPVLRRNLLLPPRDPEGALLGFITRYIDSVPGSLRLIAAFSKRLGFYAYAAPFLHKAEDYFLNPPNDIPQQDGLEALLDEAFLAHRLLEEVNDNHIRQVQRTLLPLDMTEANIIVHHLIGDELATRLERLVQHTASSIFSKEHIWEPLRSLPGGATAPATVITSDALMQAPRGIKLRLGEQAGRETR